MPRLFVNARFFILQNDVPLGSRFALGFANAGPDVSPPGIKSRRFISRMHADRRSNSAGCGGEMFGRVFQAFFITREEDEFLDAYGAHAFEEEFFKAEEDRLSVRRKPCV